jgi:hypothetical protein
MNARRLALGVSALLMGLSTHAHASWFEFCELGGELQTVARDRSGGPGAYRVEVHVDEAAESPGERGYTDCREYMGLTVEATVVFPRVKGPAPGLVLRFQRIAVDTVDPQGESGTAVRTRFRSLRAASADRPPQADE